MHILGSGESEFNIPYFPVLFGDIDGISPLGFSSQTELILDGTSKMHLINAFDNGLISPVVTDDLFLLLLFRSKKYE